MKITGKCHCGNIGFTADVDPNTVGICHCTDCQTFSGSAWRASIPTTTFALTSGEPRIYVKTAQSGRRRAQAFCPDCGTAIYATTADTPPTVWNLRIGTIAERAQLKPHAQIWHRSHVPWAKDLNSVPSIETDGS